MAMGGVKKKKIIEMKDLLHVNFYMDICKVRKKYLCKIREIIFRGIIILESMLISVRVCTHKKKVRK